MFRISLYIAVAVCVRTCGGSLSVFVPKRARSIYPMISRGVYAPGEDTYTLIDALEKNIDVFANKTVLEIGCGSGEVLCFLEKRCPCALLIGTDTNYEALSVSCRRVERGCYMLVDLLCCFNQKHVDVVIFNPPYVETESAGGPGISSSYSGGECGRVVIDRFVRSVEVPLVFLLVTRKNMPADVICELKRRGYALVETVEKRRVLGETLVVIRAERNGCCIEQARVC